jgi:hypothetical protein
LEQKVKEQTPVRKRKAKESSDEEEAEEETSEKKRQPKGTKKSAKAPTKEVSSEGEASEVETTPKVLFFSTGFLFTIIQVSKTKKPRKNETARLAEAAGKNLGAFIQVPKEKSYLVKSCTVANVCYVMLCLQFT